MWFTLNCPRGTQPPKPSAKHDPLGERANTQTLMEAKIMSNIVPKFDFVTSLKHLENVHTSLKHLISTIQLGFENQDDKFNKHFKFALDLQTRIEELETKVHEFDELQTKVEDLESHVSEALESDKDEIRETVQDVITNGTFTFDY